MGASAPGNSGPEEKKEVGEKKAEKERGGRGRGQLCSWEQRAGRSDEDDGNEMR